MRHEIDVSQVNDVAETTGIYMRTDRLRMRKLTVIGSRPRRSCISWMVSQLVVLLEALSRVVVYS